MGKEKHAMFHKVKKILSGKDKHAREMAEVLDGVMEGKQYSREKQQQPVDETEKLKATIAEMQKKLDEKAATADANSKEKLM